MISQVYLMSNYCPEAVPDTLGIVMAHVTFRNNMDFLHILLRQDVANK